MTDTRSPVAGKLFVALEGEHFDGHAFVRQAAEQGAAAVLVNADKHFDAGACPIIRVHSPLRALGALAQFHRDRWGGEIVAVGGSAGKTTTRSAIGTVLDALLPGEVHTPAGNLNNQVGVPLVLLGLGAPHRLAVVEIGTNQPGEVALLGSLARPNIAVLTLIDIEHSEGLGTLDAIAREEGDLLRAIEATGTLVVNSDDLRIAGELPSARTKSVVSVGFEEASTYRILERRTTPALTTRFRVERPSGSLQVEIPLLGEAGARAATLALAVAERVLGRPLSAEAFGRACARMRGEPGRLQATRLLEGTLVINDTYNANPPSMRSSIELACELARGHGGKLILVLGAMRELGSLSESSHQAIGELAGRAGARALIAVGPECRSLAAAARRFTSAVEFVESTAEAVPALERALQSGDVVLLKGSRALHLEQLSEWLIEKLGSSQTAINQIQINDGSGQ